MMADAVSSIQFLDEYEPDTAGATPHRPKNVPELPPAGDSVVLVDESRAYADDDTSHSSTGSSSSATD